MEDSEAFAIFFHHGGGFVESGGAKVYIGGNYVGRYDLDPDRFGFFDVVDEIKRLGYVSWKGLAYSIPKTIVFKDLVDDKSVMDMLKHLSDRCRVLDIFVDDGIMIENNLTTSNLVDQFSDDPEVDAIVDSLDFEDMVDSEVRIETEVDRQLEDDEDLDYEPSEDDETDDEMDTSELCSDNDDEYTEARRRVADKSFKGLCEEVFKEHVVEGGFSDYENSSDEVYSDETDDENHRIRGRIKRVVFDPKSDLKTLQIKLGMRFQDGLQAREAIKTNAIENGWEIHFTRTSREQMEARCTAPCMWGCYGSINKSTGVFVIKRVGEDHSCTRAMRNIQVTCNWIAKTYLNVFRLRPNLTVAELKKDILDRYSCHVSIGKLYTAKRKAIEKLRGTVDEHYAKLRSYILELRRVDQDGRFELRCDIGSIFKGIYIGFSALRKGFKVGCRRVIGLDGAFLKTYLGGVLLCAVAKDGNNQMFPIAWCVVEVENEANWKWFLELLIEELDISTGLGTTFISDQQKGLLNAVHELAPHAEHRNCARHVYCNWKKNHKGSTLKNLFWKACRSTYDAEYTQALKELEHEDQAAYDNFLERDPSKFCKVFVNPMSVCDMILNNISETFNGYILNARDKHIIHMLEEIRSSLMERQYRKLKDIDNYSDRICPAVRVKLEKIKYASRYCIARPAIGEKFEVEKHDDRFIVDMGSRTCSCREWDITGIPCVHTCAVIYFLKEKAESYVHDYFSLEKYKLAYEFGVPPLNGEKMWPRAEGIPVKPPHVKKMPGRPKKKRNKSQDEITKHNPNKLRKVGVQMTCQKCLQIGHNSRGCKNAPVQKAEKEKGKRGRPRKNPSKAPAASTTSSQILKSKVVDSNSTPHVDRRVMRKERAIANGGLGVLVTEAGNIYINMSSQNRATFVPSTSTVTNMGTQESRN